MFLYSLTNGVGTRNTSTVISLRWPSYLVNLGWDARSMVSANHWLKGIKTGRLLWFLTRVSANHASSNWALVDKTKHSMLRPDLAWFKRILNTCSEVNQQVKFLKLFFQKFPLLYETGLGELRCWGNFEKREWHPGKSCTFIIVKHNQLYAISILGACCLRKGRIVVLVKYKRQAKIKTKPRLFILVHK